MAALLEILCCPLRVKREVKLVSPTKLKASLAQCIIANNCSSVLFGNIGCMGGNFVCNNALPNILYCWQADMLLGVT